MAVSLQHCLLSRISARATLGDSAISACRILRLPCRLIHWNVDFMELLKIQIYLIVFCWDSCKHRDGIVILSSIDPEMYVWSSSWSVLGHHATHPLASKIITIAAWAWWLWNPSPSCLTWSFPTPIAWTHKPPKEISLKNLIDTCRHTLFIFVCFGWGLNSRCWATNQG
jgi:hypothetical protein